MFCNFLILLLIPVISCYDWSSLNLVKTHVPYVLSHQPYLKQLCLEDSSCPYQVSLQMFNSNYLNFSINL